MKLAFVLDPLDDIKPPQDTSRALMEEAVRRAHELFVLYQEGILCRDGVVHGIGAPIRLTGEKEGWYEPGEKRETPLSGFDAVLVRKGPPFDMEYVYSTFLLELAETQGARVVNRPRALRDYSEPFSIMRFARYTAPILVSRVEREIRAFLEAQGEIVLRSVDGVGSASVFRLDRHDRNIDAIIETLNQNGRRTVMAQRYNGDGKRIFLIDGRPAPYALAHNVKPDETRGNLALDGRGVAQALSPRDREIAEAIGPVLAAEGMLLVGLDVIGDCLAEIHVASPAGMREIMDQTGLNVAGMFIDVLERGGVNDHPPREG